MPGIGIGLSSAFGTKPLYYLLRDEFLDTLAAGSVDGTPATPGPGTRTVVVDTDSKLSIGSGVANVLSHSIPATGDPGVWYGRLTRAAGQMLIAEAIVSAGGRAYVGLDINTAGAAGSAGSFYFKAQQMQVVGYGGNLFPYSSATSYQVAVVERSTGIFYFIKGGAFATWTLVWIDASVTGNNYPCLIAGNAAGSMTNDYIRVPDALWLPTPLVSDGFTDDNGVSLNVHSSDGLGHAEGIAGGLGSGGGGTAWVEVTGNWDIQSNRANPDGGAIAVLEANEADAVIDCTVDPAGNAGVILRYLDSDDWWWFQLRAGSNDIRLLENDGGSTTSRATTAFVNNTGTDYALRVVCSGQTIDCYVNGGNKISYGSASLHETETKYGLNTTNTNAEFDDFTIYARAGYSTLSAF